MALRVADIRVCDRVAFQRALTSGMTAHEYRQSPKRARDEMAAVVRACVRRALRAGRSHADQYGSFRKLP